MESRQDRKLAKSRARVIKALGHPTRIYMVELLSKQDLSVGELTQAVQADVSTVSKHLSLLKQAGILGDRKEGNRVFYVLLRPCIMGFIHCIDDVIFEDAQQGISCLRPS